jgi:hypothetical protein
MNIGRNYIELTLLESILAFKRKITWNKVIKEEISEKVEYPNLRWFGTFVPGLIIAGTFYRVKRKDLIFALLPLIVFSMFVILAIQGIFIKEIIFLFPLTLVPIYLLTKKYPKEFWFVVGKAKKYRIIYTDGEYSRIVLAYK